jgi:hypothetical protein
MGPGRDSTASSSRPPDCPGVLAMGQPPDDEAAVVRVFWPTLWDNVLVSGVSLHETLRQMARHQRLVGRRAREFEEQTVGAFAPPTAGRLFGGGLDPEAPGKGTEGLGRDPVVFRPFLLLPPRQDRHLDQPALADRQHLGMDRRRTEK